MDIATFFVRLIEALAWPCAAVVIVFAFRNELRALVPLVRSLKAGPLEAVFEREVEEISQQVPVASVLNKNGSKYPDQRMLMDLARVNPRSAILESWLRVESALRRVVLQRIGGSPLPDVSSPVKNIQELYKCGIIKSDDAALFQDLRGLRNQAAHLSDFNPSHESALDYVKLSAQLSHRFEELASIN